jgi:ABC-type transport system involved in multi-copper enzyme maturation permease subunit
MNRIWLAQIASIIRLEMRKTFFAKRGLWIYLLALAPVGIYFAHSIDALDERGSRRRLAGDRPVSAEAAQSITNGMTLDEVVAQLGPPHDETQFRPEFRGKRKGKSPAEAPPVRGMYRYSDGKDVYNFYYLGDRVDGINRDTGDSMSEDSLIFAFVFQSFYLRLAVFFGCVGVFMNLFRGEMLDKSLHFYMLAPVRREVLTVGKYLAGLIATVTIFTTSTFLQMLAMSWHFDGQEFSQYLAGPGWGHAAAYLGVTALACLGYGSVFLAAGLLFRNPIIPAAAVLLWEGANLFLPAVLKKISIIFYLQSLSPVVAPPDQNMPPPLRLLINSAEPTPAPIAILGLLVVTGVVLALAARQARRLEINYGTD